MTRISRQRPIPPRSALVQRVEQLRRTFTAIGVDAFLVTFQPHLQYLSGFSGSSGIGLVTSRHSCLITDGRYRQQVKDEVASWSVTISNTGLFEGIASTRLLRSGLRIGFDGNNVSLTQYRQLKKTFPAVRFIPRSETIEQLCARKDGREIDLIRKAVSITDEVFDGILTLIKPGVPESEIAAEITYRQRLLGADRDAFEPIVASGERSALPHGRATTRKLRNGDLLTLDFGCVVGGYHSDMTRTVGIGRLSTEAKKIYSAVLDAQQLASDHVREGIECRELDRIARDRIASAGYGKFFQHSLGHGIGLQIHEAPRISVQSKGRLASGNVITIEPGIYVPGIGGVRIEDDLVVTANGSDVLNTSVKDLIIL